MCVYIHTYECFKGNLARCGHCNLQLAWGSGPVLAHEMTIALIADARPAPEAGDAHPTHGSSDFPAFLQSEIVGQRRTSRLVHKTSTHED